MKTDAEFHFLPLIPAPSAFALPPSTFLSVARQKEKTTRRGKQRLNSIDLMGLSGTETETNSSHTECQDTLILDHKLKLLTCVHYLEG